MIEKIRSQDLTIDRVPTSSARLNLIWGFASTFDIAESSADSDLHASDFVSQQRSLPELREYIYFQYRRFNHFGESPDRLTEDAVRKAVELIRAKLLKL
jgi:hypothetical protein